VPGFELTTPRLRLREWSDADLEPFAAMNADPRVMAFFPSVLSRAESDAAADRIRSRLARRGFGLWPVELRGQADADGPPFIGVIGLSLVELAVPFAPCVEVGWRLLPAYWGQGYATEAARAAMTFGYTQAGLEEIVSFTAVLNLPSQRVMQRLGMRRAPEDDFLHPLIAPGHPLQPHVVYRQKQSDWRRSAEMKK
jgi:ribosomal-protein-alanine N-acetyltransferase